MPDLAPISHRIWDMKYRFKRPDGTPVDNSVTEMWQRVADAVAANEREPAVWTPIFEEALSGFRFLPAGRILSGAGTGRSVTLFNCFVMGRIEDDLGAIFSALREAALTMQQGGGIGFDFSTIRPVGAPVHGVGADASGPLSFMEVWNSMCQTIMSAGARRGAMMATLRCDHPDVEAFIDAKQEPGRLRNFNLSVLVTDAFMQAVDDDGPWPLVFDGLTYRTLRARLLWDRIMQATYAYAEPGVIFIDRVNRLNNLAYCETINATNPCGEQPLPPYGACLLGSVNLASLIGNPFEADAALDLKRLQDLTRVAVRMMDDVIDVSRFPLPRQKEEAQAKRRIGLGVTGLADALILCGVRYGSRRAVELTETWLCALRNSAYRASIDLAAEKGPFPLFDRDRYLEAPTIRTLDADLRQGIAEHGIRNALLTSIAPTGTISLLADNVSSGIEPVFAYTYERTVRAADGSLSQATVADHAYRLFRDRFGDDAPLPDAFVDAAGLDPNDHLVMQAAAQKYIDSSISKTINCPENLSFDAFKDVYAHAYAMGCKGCTTYRPNPVTGAVLSTRKEAPPAPSIDDHRPLDRPESLPGETYKVRWPDSDHAMYITINDIVAEGRRRPFEVFINSKNMEHYAWTVALTRMISAVFRRGGDVSFVVEELKAVFDPRGGAWIQGRYVPSLLAAIGEVIERHMQAIGFIADPDAGSSSVSPLARSCPKCGQPALVRQEGCETCTNCGYSRCG